MIKSSRLLYTTIVLVALVSLLFASCSKQGGNADTGESSQSHVSETAQEKLLNPAEPRPQAVEPVLKAELPEKEAEAVPAQVDANEKDIAEVPPMPAAIPEEADAYAVTFSVFGSKAVAEVEEGRAVITYDEAIASVSDITSFISYACSRTDVPEGVFYSIKPGVIDVTFSGTLEKDYALSIIGYLGSLLDQYMTELAAIAPETEKAEPALKEIEVVVPVPAEIPAVTAEEAASEPAPADEAVPAAEPIEENPAEASPLSEIALEEDAAFKDDGAADSPVAPVVSGEKEEPSSPILDAEEQPPVHVESPETEAEQTVPASKPLYEGRLGNALDIMASAYGDHAEVSYPSFIEKDDVDKAARLLVSAYPIAKEVSYSFTPEGLSLIYPMQSESDIRMYAEALGNLIDGYVQSLDDHAEEQAQAEIIETPGDEKPAAEPPMESETEKPQPDEDTREEEKKEFRRHSFGLAFVPYGFEDVVATSEVFDARELFSSWAFGVSLGYRYRFSESFDIGGEVGYQGFIQGSGSYAHQIPAYITLGYMHNAGKAGIRLSAGVGADIARLFDNAMLELLAKAAVGLEYGISDDISIGFDAGVSFGYTIQDKRMRVGIEPRIYIDCRF